MSRKTSVIQGDNALLLPKLNLIRINDSVFSSGIMDPNVNKTPTYENGSAVEIKPTGVIAQPEPVNYEHLEEEEAKTNGGIIANLKMVLQLTVTKRMLVLMPEILWCGISIAYYSGMLVLIMSDSLEEVGDDNPQ